jgi:uncharacterized protein involved in exopolysaccharide biosynthesis
MERMSALELDWRKIQGDIARSSRRFETVSAKERVKRGLTAGGADMTPSEFIQPDDFKRLATERLFEEVELNSLRAKEETISRAIAEINSRLRVLPKLQSRYDSARNRLAAQERDYIQLTDAYQEAVVRATGVLSEVSVVSPASVPVVPATPIKFYHVGLAIALGIFASIAFIYVLTYFNIRMFFPSAGVSARRVPEIAAAARTTQAERESGANDA